MYDLSNKVALVTGTSRERGLGRAMALRLASEGADIVVTDQRQAPGDTPPWEKESGWRGMDSLTDEIRAMGRRALAITADITDHQQVKDMVRQAERELGRIDILVNNAGFVTHDVNVVDMDEESWERTLSVNTTGAFLMCKAVAPGMIRRGEGGKIVNISSKLGKVGVAGSAAYCASKFGVVGLTHALALELAQYKINVNAVCPGVMVTWSIRGQNLYENVKSGLTEAEAVVKEYVQRMRNSPFGRPATPQEMANVVAFLVSNQSEYITGQAINVSAGEVLY
ncbi:MAG: SDR family oxidoreductase [Chloroflexi bacterium]|nr:SDR family oxidoreductase [Chloroflexota bacterium]